MLGFNFCNAKRIIDAVSVAVFGAPLYNLGEVASYSYDESTLTCLVSRELSLLYGEVLGGEISRSVADSLLKLEAALLADAGAIYDRDPAAKSIDEVILTYPGFFAVFCHRLANILYVDGATLVARFIAEYAHSRTGADIHPGATIGERFSIDHATGIVIGETAVIGSDVAIYHGVTMGARNLPRRVEDRCGKEKRHPTIEDGCVIYAGAGIFGGETVIGRDSVIGAGARIASSVPPNSCIFK